MWKPRLTQAQLKWVANAVIPFAIACGFITLAIGTHRIVLSSISWRQSVLLMIGELVVVGAICQLTYRFVRLREVGDVED